MRDNLIAEVSRHVDRRIGPIFSVFHEIVSDDLQMDMLNVKSSLFRRCEALVTSGVSAMPMAVTPDSRQPSFAEAPIVLPEGWPRARAHFNHERNYWPVRLLNSLLARCPRHASTWLGFGHSDVCYTYARCKSPPPKVSTPESRGSPRSDVGQTGARHSRGRVRRGGPLPLHQPIVRGGVNAPDTNHPGPGGGWTKPASPFVPRDVLNLCVALALLLAMNSMGWSHDRDAAAATLDSEWSKSNGELRAALVVTAQLEEFMREWYGTPESHTPKLRLVDQVKRGEVIAALLFFSGCGEPGGNCSALADFTVLRPDGSVYSAAPGNQVWSHPVPSTRLTLLSEAYLEIRLGPGDPLGPYSVLVVFRDPDSNRVLELKRGFEVVE